MSRVLAALARLRRLEADSARRALAQAVAAESAAEQAAAGAEAALRQETGDIDAASMTALRNLAAWLPRGTAARQAAGRALADAKLATADARQALAAARAALAAVETLADAEARDARQRRVRREGIAVDDALRGRK